MLNWRTHLLLRGIRVAANSLQINRDFIEYLKILEKEREKIRRQLESASEWELVCKLQGQIRGLRFAMEYVDKVVKRELDSPPEDVE